MPVAASVAVFTTLIGAHPLDPEAGAQLVSSGLLEISAGALGVVLGHIATATTRLVPAEQRTEQLLRICCNCSFIGSAAAFLGATESLARWPYETAGLADFASFAIGYGVIAWVTGVQLLRGTAPPRPGTGGASGPSGPGD